MGMFGGSSRPVFKPSLYQPGKRSRRLPRGLVLFLVGLILGAGGLLFLQANYGPQRLTIEQSEQLHTELNTVNAERQRLQVQLDEAVNQRDNNLSTHEQQATALAQARTRIETLDREVMLLQNVIPPDPRGGVIGIRAAIFKRQSSALDYQVLIMRENPDDPPFQGKLELIVDGNFQNGRRERITPEPVPLTLERYEHPQGTITLPANYLPRSVTLRVLDTQQKPQAMRIYYVRNSDGSRSATTPN